MGVDGREDDGVTPVRGPRAAARASRAPARASRAPLHAARSRAGAVLVALVAVLGLVACQQSAPMLQPVAPVPSAGDTGSAGDAGTDAPDATDPTDGADDAAALVPGPSSTSIDWAGCGNGYECATVLVPLDHADPDGDQVRIALKRLPASGEKQGTIVVNPGGPGESGTLLVTSAPDIFGPDVLEHFDILGFDPRGVGDSTHVVCLGDGESDPSAGDYDFYDSEDVARFQADLESLGEMCRAHSGALLDHVGTAEVVQDLEQLRGLLGEERLNYLGFSYGTLVGALYADAHADRVGRMVLDGAIDPSLDYRTLNEQQLTAFDAAFGRFVAVCQEQRSCPLDADPEVAEQDVLDLADDLDADPAPSDAPDGELVGWELIWALQSVLYSSYDWEWFAGELASVADGGDGSELDAYGASAITSNDPNYPFWYTAVDCADYPVTGTFADAMGHSRVLAKKSPVFGTGMVGEALCVAWPAQSHAVRAPVSGTGAAPLLVIGTRYDPATPYAWAVALASQLESATLLTYEGDGHTVYGGVSDCVDEIVDHYLLTGEVPVTDATCP